MQQQLSEDLVAAEISDESRLPSYDVGPASLPLDQLGDRGTLYNFAGEPVSLEESYAPFIKEMKNSLATPLVMNAVNQYGQTAIAASPKGASAPHA